MKSFECQLFIFIAKCTHYFIDSFHFEKVSSVKLSNQFVCVYLMRVLTEWSKQMFVAVEALYSDITDIVTFNQYCKFSNCSFTLVYDVYFMSLFKTMWNMLIWC